MQTGNLMEILTFHKSSERNGCCGSLPQARGDREDQEDLRFPLLLWVQVDPVNKANMNLKLDSALFPAVQVIMSHVPADAVSEVPPVAGSS